ncbi:prepilin peptidase [Lignipirellula cremea]|uniref:Leader peptidase PppA n=1 Tax=Lignipirellula cremea TaxID=2528010 RepID=A0A518DPE8_9BACT|nr:prepilin peptidase [Lignipirellula cremea]QDU93720.1 Leader peptidase PppA [Lignipirellula cremea]
MSSVARFFRRRWPILLPLGVLLAAWLAYAVISPAITGALQGGRTGLHGDMVWFELRQAFLQRSLAAFVWLWFFMLGGAIGSYLNVVVWRVPRGMSVAGGGSKCPFCRTPIRKTDNIPVLGWLRLNGRCRACRLPIAARYPIVELVMGLTFLSVAIAGPLDLAHPLESGIQSLILDGQWRPAASYAWQVTLLTLLLGAGLILYDGFPIPWSFAIFAFLVGTCAPLAYGELYPVEWGSGPGFPAWSRTPLTMAVGLAAGILLGAGVHLLTNFSSGPAGQRAGGVMLAFAIAGLYLGWQAVLTTAATTLLLTLAGRLVLGQTTVVLALFAAAWVQTICGKWMSLWW